MIRQQQEALLGQYAQRQAQQASRASALGGILGGTSTDTADIEQSLQQYVPLYPSPLPTPRHRLIKFFRINEKVELSEGEMIKEPLDELRIKVAKWLNN